MVAPSATTILLSRSTSPKNGPIPTWNAQPAAEGQRLVAPLRPPSGKEHRVEGLSGLEIDVARAMLIERIGEHDEPVARDVDQAELCPVNDPRNVDNTRLKPAHSAASNVHHAELGADDRSDTDVEQSRRLKTSERYGIGVEQPRARRRLRSRRGPTPTRWFRERLGEGRPPRGRSTG